MTSITFRRDIMAIPAFIPDAIPQKAGKPFNQSDLVRLASNESPLPPFDGVLEMAASWMKKANRYPDNNCKNLRDDLARQTGASTEEIIVTNGSSELIFALARALLEPGSEMIVSELTFPLYGFCAKLAGAALREIPHIHFEHDLDGMLAAVTPATRLLVICNPNTPTGNVIPPAELHQFLQVIPPHVLVVVDEAYIDYVDEDQDPKLLAHVPLQDNLLVVRTFSKIYGLAGLRVGYGIARSSLAYNLKKVLPPFTVNMMAQLAAIESLKYQEEVQLRREWTAAQRLYLSSGFESLGIQFVPSCTNFIFAKLGALNEEIQEALLDGGLWIRETPLRDWFRVTIGTQTENSRLLQKLGAS